MTDHEITVAIVEDDASLRNGLCLLIDGTRGYRCVGEFGSVAEALQRLGEEGADVLLLDIQLPVMLGSEGVSHFKQKFPWMQILMLTVYDEQEKVFESICRGACGYLLKKTPPAKLLEAISEAHAGGAPMSPEIARKVITLFQQTRAPETVDHDLTPQEVRLLRLLAQGFSYQACAEQLAISVNTIRNYIRSIYDKLHVHTKSEAVTKALRSGVIS
jgi:DNA-binding NarL/FixJ family response regulator